MKDMLSKNPAKHTETLNTENQITESKTITWFLIQDERYKIKLIKDKKEGEITIIKESRFENCQGRNQTDKWIINIISTENITEVNGLIYIWTQQVRSKICILLWNSNRNTISR